VKKNIERLCVDDSRELTEHFAEFASHGDAESAINAAVVCGGCAFREQCLQRGLMFVQGRIPDPIEHKIMKFGDRMVVAGDIVDWDEHGFRRMRLLGDYVAQQSVQVQCTELIVEPESWIGNTDLSIPPVAHSDHQTVLVLNDDEPKIELNEPEELELEPERSPLAVKVYDYVFGSHENLSEAEWDELEFLDDVEFVWTLRDEILERGASSVTTFFNIVAESTGVKPLKAVDFTDKVAFIGSRHAKKRVNNVVK